MTPGQGQTVNIAGVEVGDVTEVELEDGDGVVTLSIQEEYADLIHEDATMLLRPRTGLQDITVEVDAGTRGEHGRGGVDDPALPDAAERAAGRNPGDARRRHPGVPEAAARRARAGLRRSRQAALGRPAALSRSPATSRRSTSCWRSGAQNIRGSIHNFRLVAEELGRNDRVVADWVDSSNAALRAFANQEGSIRETLQEAPSALRETQRALRSANRFSLASTPRCAGSSQRRGRSARR